MRDLPPLSGLLTILQAASVAALVLMAVGIFAAEGNIARQIAVDAATRWSNYLGATISRTAKLGDAGVLSTSDQLDTHDTFERLRASGSIPYYRVASADGIVLDASDAAEIGRRLPEAVLKTLAAGKVHTETHVDLLTGRSLSTGNVAMYRTIRGGDGAAIGSIGVLVDRSNIGSPTFLTMKIGVVAVFVLMAALWVIGSRWVVVQMFQQRVLRERYETAMRDLELAEEVAHVGYWAYDPRSQAIEWSRETTRIYGQDPDTFRPTLEYLATAHPGDDDLIAGIFTEGVPEGTGLEFERRIARPNDEQRDLLFAVRSDKDGRLFGIVSDITQRKAAQRALAVSERQLREALEASAAATWEWDMVRDVFKVAERLPLMLGNSPTQLEIPRAEHMSRTHPDDVERLTQAFNAHFADGLPYDVEYRVRHADGHYIWFHTRGRISERDGDKPLRMLGTVIDITRRRTAEEELRRSQESISLVLQASAAGYFDTKIAIGGYWSPRLREILGIADPDFVPGPDSFTGMIDPPHFPQVRELIREFLYSDTQRSVDFETCLRRASDNRRIWVNVRAVRHPDSAGGADRVVGFVQDITARREAEEQLRESQEIVKAALDAADAGYFDVNMEARTVTWSPRMHEILGYPLDMKPLFETFPSLVHPDDFPLFEAGSLKSEPGRDRSSGKVEVRARHANGSYIWLSIWRMREFAANGKLARSTGLIQDISAEREAEQKLRESQEIFKLAVDAANAGYFDINPLAQTVSWAPRTCEMLGFEPDFKPGFDTFTNLVHPDDRHMVALEGSGLHSRTINVQVRAQHTSGKYIWLNIWRQRQFDASGQLLRSTGLIQDISEEREAVDALAQSEERFRLLADNVSEMITIRDIDGRIIYASPSAKTLTGLEPSELIGRSGLEIIHPDDVALVRNARELGPDGRPRNLTKAVQFRIRRKDGSVVWSETRNSTFTTHDGALRVVGSTRDITQRVEHEDELRRARDRLQEQADELMVLAQNLDIERERAERANTAKSQFLALMSHELRTPMTGVLGMADLLLMTDLSEEQKDLTGRLIRSARVLIDLLNDILDFSKIEAGQLVVESSPFRVADVLTDLRDLFTPLASAKGLVLTIGEISGPETIVSDPKRLRQVLVNLVGNAIKFTQRGGVTVTMASQPGPFGRTMLRFDVHDTGIGISDDQKQRLFQPFIQAEASTSRKFGGTGLGLAISRRLARALGGEVTFVSEVGKGSTFSATILPEASAAIPAAEPIARGTAPVKASPKVILLAEDNDTSRVLISTMLGRRGHTVTAVSDGQKAVEAAAKARFDILLLDMQMPIMDGVEAMQLIRASEKETGRRTPIIALTADVIAEHQVFYRESGADVIVPKPVDWLTLDAEMERLVVAARPALASPELRPPADPTPVLLDFNHIQELTDTLGQETLASMVPGFIESTVTYRDAIVVAANNGNLRDARRSAHALKGLCAQFGAQRLAEVARAIEYEADSPAAVSARLPELSTISDQTSAAVRERFRV